MNAVSPTGHHPGISDRDLALAEAALNAAVREEQARERRLAYARRLVAAERAGIASLETGEPMLTPRGRYLRRVLGAADFLSLLAELP